MTLSMQKFAETNDNRALHEQYPIGVSAPSHSLLGFGPELLLTHTGIAIVIHVFLEDLGYACNRDSMLVWLYPSLSIADQGMLFIETCKRVYPRMVIGK
jgi:predicted membrane GTPase involved in stress response